MITAEEVEAHEAGHAVVASVLVGTRPVVSASVIARGRSLGRVILDDRPEEPSWEGHLAEAIGCRVGEVAGARAVGRKLPDEPIGADLSGYLIELGNARRDAPAHATILDRVEKLSDAFVTIAWPTIEDVATELHRRAELSGAEIRSIVARRWPQKITVRDLELMLIGEAQAAGLIAFAVRAALLKQVAIARVQQHA